MAEDYFKGSLTNILALITLSKDIDISILYAYSKLFI